MLVYQASFYICIYIWWDVFNNTCYACQHDKNMFYLHLKTHFLFPSPQTYTYFRTNTAKQNTCSILLSIITLLSWNIFSVFWGLPKNFIFRVHHMNKINQTALINILNTTTSFILCQEGGKVLACLLKFWADYIYRNCTEHRRNKSSCVTTVNTIHFRDKAT
jgi:hypothetical protein